MKFSAIRTFQLVYVSHLTPGMSDAAVATMAALARHRQRAVKISGGLLFDGHRFCELQKGSEADVSLSMTRINADGRHHRVSVSAAGHFGLPRLTTTWRLTCCKQEVLDPLHATPRATGNVALALFMSALAAANES